MSVFICENRKNPLMAGGSTPKPLVAIVLIEDNRYENIYWTGVVSKVQLYRHFLMQKSYAVGTCSFSLEPCFHAKKGL